MTKNIIITLVCLFLSTSASIASAEEITGTWCTKGDARECAVLSSTGNSMKGEFRHNGQKTVDLIGYRSGNGAAFSFKNAKGEVGAWMVVGGAGTLQAICLNPDGSLRWKAEYIKKQ